MTAPTPRRIQRRRTRGWRMPVGAVYVGRPTRWGNPYRVSDPLPVGHTRLFPETVTPARAVALYRQHLRDHPDLVAAARAELAGKDLACWCALDAPCHADVLIEVANGGTP